MLRASREDCISRPPDTQTPVALYYVCTYINALLAPAVCVSQPGLYYPRSQPKNLNPCPRNSFRQPYLCCRICDT